MLVALIFIGLPFVVRTVQPVLEDLERELEEAAASLGATRWQTFRRVIVLPALLPALLTGFALAFARALGEYGSVIFIAGNMPMMTEITPLLIITKLEQYDYAGATAIAVVMLVVSFVLLLVINRLQAWQQRRRADWRCRASLALDAQRRAADEPRAGAAGLLIARRARAFLALFLLLPLAAVFVEALQQGLAAPTSRRSSSPTRSPRSGSRCSPRRSRCRSTSSSASPPPGRSPSSTSAARAC